MTVKPSAYISAAPVVLLLSILAGTFSAVRAQDPGPIWAGAYTTEQAARGRTVVQQHCSECHHDDLTGGEGPALVGPTFMIKWETHSVERLFHKIRDTMPSMDNDDVTAREKLDTVAFILQRNGYPAGPKELTEDDDLAAIYMVPKGGVGLPRAGALVRAIGCLQETAPGQWALTESAEPQVTTLEPLSAEDRASAASTAPGTQTIQLLSVFPSPVAMKGHKALAKGLFIITPSGSRINVMSLESVASECTK